MINIWRMTVPLSTHLHLAASKDYCETPIRVIQNVYMDPLAGSEMGFLGGHVGERPPVAAELTLAVEDFEHDYFTWGGCMFVSERMRDVMALDPSEVRFFEIDDSRSAPLPRSKRYLMMEPSVEEDVSDPENSAYRPESDPKASLYGPHDVRSLFVRPDAAPTHDLFYDQFFATILLCTDRFASRVLKAGCTGMSFEDPTRYGDGRRLCRTLRGIEQYVGSGQHFFDVTKLIQAID